jgi:tape measure domain-containing protein
MATVDEIKIVVRAEVDAAIAKMKQLDETNKSNAKTGLDLAKSIAGYTTAYGLAVQAGRAVISGMADMVKTSVQLAAAQERVKMEFSVLTGSMETANDLFNKMNALASQTPLELENITAAGKQLLSVGIPVDEITNKLRMLGDVAMGNPEKLERLTLAFGQLKSKGVASMEQLNRFIEAGVPIMKELEKQTGATGAEVFKMVSEGKIGFADVEKALKNMTDEGGLYHDMMNKVAETAEGKFSTAMDNTKLQLAEIGKTMLPAVTKALDWFNKVMEEFSGKRNLSSIMSGGTGDIQSAIDMTRNLLIEQKALNSEMMSMYGNVAPLEMEEQIRLEAQLKLLLNKQRVQQETAGKVAAANKLVADSAAASAAATAVQESALAKLADTFIDFSNQIGEVESGEGIALTVEQLDELDRAINPAKYALEELSNTWIDFSNHVGELINEEGIPATTNQLIELERATNPAAWALQEFDATFIDFSNHIGELVDGDGIPATAKQLDELDRAINPAKYALEELSNTFMDFSNHVGELVNSEGIPATIAQLVDLEKATNPAAWALQEFDATFIDFSNHIGEIDPGDGIALTIDQIKEMRYLMGLPPEENGIVWAYEQIAKASETAALKEVENTRMVLKANQDMSSGIIDTYTMMSAAMGQALVLGEDGWKSLGRTTLNVIAGSIEALAQEAIVTAGLLMTNVLAGDFMEVPALLKAGATIGLAYGAAGMVRAIPMAEGGSGIVTKPTLFLAGESGAESFAFGGANNKRGMGNVTVIQNIAGSVISEREVKRLAISGVSSAGRGW